MSESIFPVSSSRLRIVFLALLADTLLLSVVMGWAGQPLATPAAPNGIVSFELAGSAAASQAILDSWDARSQVHAAFIQGLDFLYLLVYAATFSLAGLYAAQVLQRLGWPLARLGNRYGWYYELDSHFLPLKISATIRSTVPLVMPRS